MARIALCGVRGLRPLSSRAVATEALPETLQSCLRVGHATEETLRHFMQGQEWALGNRVDAQHFRVVAQEHFAQIDSWRQSSHTPASSLVPLLRPIGFLTGAALSCAPTSTRMAVYGALQDSVSDSYNDHIRTLLELDSAQKQVDLKTLFVKLRDAPRVPEGATPPPDLRNLQRLEELSLSQGIGAVVKGTCRLSMRLFAQF